MGANGYAVFRDRNYKRTSQYLPQATFGNGSGELPFSDVITTQDDSKILNIISVTREGGSKQTVSDNDSISLYGAREESLSGTLNVSDANTLAIANQRLAQFSNTSPRIEGLIVNPLSDSDLWVQVLNRELGDKITIKVPTTVSTVMEFGVHIDHINHEVDARNQTWTWRVKTSAGSETGAWVLGSSRLNESTNLSW